jgi:hypothetical protein
LIDSPDQTQEFACSPQRSLLIESFREEFQGSATVAENVAGKAPENNLKPQVTPTLLQAISSRTLIFTRSRQTSISGLIRFGITVSTSCKFCKISYLKTKLIGV